MKSYKGLEKDYWLFWCASSLGMGASNILQYVLSLYVLDLTGSATLFASIAVHHHLPAYPADPVGRGPGRPCP